MTERSYGIIPFYKGERGLEVFLIHQYGSGGDTLWTFPKGRPELGEEPIETALREFHEETGMALDSYEEAHPLTTQYAFTRNGEAVEKTTTYFIGMVKEKAFSIKPDEVKEAAWFSIESAREQITFPDQKGLLDDAVKNLDTAG